MRRTDLRAPRATGALALLLGLACARTVGAYCIATTCNEKNETCAKDHGCVVQGAPLHWATRCVSFGVQKDGSRRRGISYQQADDIIRDAFSQWFAADCGHGQTPSFQVWDLGEPFGGIECDQPEFNPLAPNANVWMFRDDEWPYEDENSTLALTSTVFDQNTGVLLDADVEINSFAVNITTSATSVDRDLASIVTHEAGHFLGLAHSQVGDATMYAQYFSGDLNYRSLHEDDVKGICALYRPERDVPECKAPVPPHGFSRYCSGGVDAVAPSNGCSCRLSGPASGRWERNLAFACIGALSLLLLCRRRALG